MRFTIPAWGEFGGDQPLPIAFLDVHYVSGTVERFSFVITMFVSGELEKLARASLPSVWGIRDILQPVLTNTLRDSWLRGIGK